ncbi:hypothetical protein [Variovorax ginsengisoli]|uniref:ArsR family transcriptional regulator n=1 Tax=Variovorax ginsengisoli TaxID=363844 RepID=A0ABT8SE01_9BURK|nr:hypothetical protein [Variovorax ginsengisoli]MDN8617835.1 hypothetical protein [Variovorax ginsengisoli]MDO1537005.1 hypothetical protein [Variovorax ginsengisoli]
MRPLSKAMQVLAAVGQATTYAEMQATTGFAIPLLTSYMGQLKLRGLAARVNEGAPHGEPAVWRITSAGMDALNPAEHLLAPGETTISRAIRVRPALATCWSAA